MLLSGGRSSTGICAEHVFNGIVLLRSLILQINHLLPYVFLFVSYMPSRLHGTCSLDCHDDDLTY